MVRTTKRQPGENEPTPEPRLTSEPLTRQKDNRPPQVGTFTVLVSHDAVFAGQTVCLPLNERTEGLVELGFVEPNFDVL